jgi:hypothetical protein
MERGGIKMDNLTNTLSELDIFDGLDLEDITIR